MAPTKIPLIFVRTRSRIVKINLNWPQGTMTIGELGKNGVRTSDLKEAQEIIDVFLSHGHKELDTARVYAEGTTESVRPTPLSFSHR